MAERWIRIVIYDCVVEDRDSHAAYMTYTAKNVIRVLSNCDGYEDGYWADDPETGKMAAITFWTSLPAIKAANDRLERFHEERHRLGVRVLSVNNFKLLTVGAGPGSWIEDAYEVWDRLRHQGRRFPTQPAATALHSNGNESKE